MWCREQEWVEVHDRAVVQWEEREHEERLDDTGGQGFLRSAGGAGESGLAMSGEVSSMYLVAA